MTTEELTGDFLLLDDAIWHFAPPELVAEYDRRAALPKPRRPRRKKGASDGAAQFAHSGELLRHQNFVYEPWEEAKHHLFALLFHKRLEAWGVMRKPLARIKQERIPSEIFDNPTMGWKSNVIKKFEYCYVSAVVKLPQAREAQNRIGITAATGLHQSQEAEVDSPRTATPPTLQPLAIASSPGSVEEDRKARGRPPVVEEIRVIIRELKAGGQLKGLSKKAKRNAIRPIAQERHPKLFRKSSQPSDEKINEALDAEGE